MLPRLCCAVFFFNDTATTEIYTLSLHDALPICHHLGGELRLIPADVERRDDVVEEVAGDTEGIIPVLAEAEEAVGIPGALGGELELGAQPHIPIDEIVALGIRAGAGLDGPVPLALGAIAVVGTLALDHLADH